MDVGCHYSGREFVLMADTSVLGDADNRLSDEAVVEELSLETVASEIKMHILVEMKGTYSL